MALGICRYVYFMIGLKATVESPNKPLCRAFIPNHFSRLLIRLSMNDSYSISPNGILTGTDKILTHKPMNPDDLRFCIQYDRMPKVNKP